jgi:hypothetical protein
MATRRRKSGGWLAWWLAPAGSGSRSRSRNASGWDPTSLSWWLAPAGSGSRSRSASGWDPTSLSWWLAPAGSTAPARGRGATPPRTRVAAGRHCPLCGKGARCRCRMTSGQPIRRPRRPRGAPPYAYPPDFRAQGAVWCGNCRHRINTYTGRCTNTTCPR